MPAAGHAQSHGDDKQGEPTISRYEAVLEVDVTWPVETIARIT